MRAANDFFAELLVDDTNGALLACRGHDESPKPSRLLRTSEGGSPRQGA
jgi:hypothetical protein